MNQIERLKYENYKIEGEEGSTLRCGQCTKPTKVKYIRKYEKYPVMCLPCFLAELTAAPKHAIDKIAAMVNEDTL